MQETNALQITKDEPHEINPYWPDIFFFDWTCVDFMGKCIELIIDQ